MAVEKIQLLLARLYTDGNLRNHYAIEPNEVVSSFNLLQHCSELSTINLHQLQKFSLSLIQKRLKTIEEILIDTFEALGKKKFGAFFLEYAYNQPLLRQENAYIMDAIAFTDFLITSQNKLNLKKHIINVIKKERLYYLAN